MSVCPQLRRARFRASASASPAASRSPTAAGAASPPRRTSAGGARGSSPRSSRTCRAPTCAPSGSRCAAGVALVVVLCLLRLYPLALVAAAVAGAAPLPALPLGRRRLRGRAAPRARVHRRLGRARRRPARLRRARAREPGRAPAGRARTRTTSSGSGSSCRAPALALVLAGPLVLLPYRKFNDVLDGVIFGACCAATLLAAEALANSADFLHLGFRAAGDQGALDRAAPHARRDDAGARRRRRRRDLRRLLASLPRPRRATGRALGALGSPLLAVPLAAAALVGASVAELYLKQWWTLARHGGRRRARARLAAPARSTSACARRPPSADRAADRVPELPRADARPHLLRPLRRRAARAPEGARAARGRAPRGARVGGGRQDRRLRRARGGRDRDRGGRDRALAALPRPRRPCRAGRAVRGAAQLPLSRAAPRRRPFQSGVALDERPRPRPALRKRWHVVRSGANGLVAAGQSEARALRGRARRWSSRRDRRRPQALAEPVSRPAGRLPRRPARRLVRARDPLARARLRRTGSPRCTRRPSTSRRARARRSRSRSSRPRGGALRPSSSRRSRTRARRATSASAPFPAFQVVDALLGTLRGVRALAGVVAAVAAVAVLAGARRRARAGDDLGPTPPDDELRSRSASGSTSALLARDLAAGRRPLASAAALGRALRPPARRPPPRRSGLSEADGIPVTGVLPAAHGDRGAGAGAPCSRASSTSASTTTATARAALPRADRRPDVPRSLRPYVDRRRRPRARARSRFPADLPHGTLRPDDAALAYDVAPLRQKGSTARADDRDPLARALPAERRRDERRRPHVPRARSRRAGPQPQDVKVDGGGTHDDLSEDNLDLDVVSAIAPGAQIVNYEAPIDRRRRGRPVQRARRRRQGLDRDASAGASATRAPAGAPERGHAGAAARRAPRDHRVRGERRQRLLRLPARRLLRPSRSRSTSRPTCRRWWRSAGRCSRWRATGPTPPRPGGRTSSRTRAGAEA